MGGGIHFTVNHVREASEDELYDSFIKVSFVTLMDVIRSMMNKC